MLRAIRATVSIFSALALAAAGLFLTGAPAFADTSGDYTYAANGDGTATITDYTGADTDISIRRGSTGWTSP